MSTVALTGGATSIKFVNLTRTQFPVRRIVYMKKDQSLVVPLESLGKSILKRDLSLFAR